MKRKYILLTIAILLLFPTLFYWYEFRPTLIRQECHRYADDISKSGELNNKPRYDFRYEYCLHEKGLE